MAVFRETYVKGPDGEPAVDAEGKRTYETEMTEEYKGATFYDFERNGYHDSDFYAVVWDAEAKCVRSIEYATTRFGGTDSNRVVTDATDEVVAAMAEVEAENYRQDLIDQWRADAAYVRKGSRVRLTRTFNGRKQPKVEEGTEGTVIWRGASNYYGQGDRIGLKVEGLEEPVWMAATNVKVIEPQEVNEELINEAAAKERQRLIEARRPRHKSAPGYFNAIGTGEYGKGVILMLTGEEPA